MEEQNNVKWKAITVRLYPENHPDAQILDFLTCTGSPVTQLRNLWSAVTTPVEVRNGTLASKIDQLKHTIEKTDSDFLLRKMTEDEYAETLRSIDEAISALERKYVV